MAAHALFPLSLLRKDHVDELLKAIDFVDGVGFQR